MNSSKVHIVTLFFLAQFLVGFTTHSSPVKNVQDSVYTQLIKNLNEAKKEKSELLIAQRNSELGDYHFNSGIFTEAIGYYNSALKNYNLLKKDTSYVAIHNNLGKSYLAMNKYDAAKVFFEEALKVSETLDFIQGEAVSRSFLGSYFEKQGDYLKALEFEQQSLELFESIQDKKGIATVNENIGSIYEDLTQYDKAYTYFYRAYDEFKNSDSYAEANVLNNLGDVHRKKGEYEAAVKYTQMALEIALKLNDNNLAESAYKDLSKTHALHGNFQLAYDYLMKSDGFQEKALLDQNLNQLTALQSEYNTNKKENQIKLLQEQNKVSKANQNLLALAMFSLVTFGLILWFFVAKKRKANSKLQQYRQRMLKAELDRKNTEEEILQRDIQIKTAALSKYSLHVSQKNKILSDISHHLKNLVDRTHMDPSPKIKKIIKEIDFNLQRENEWGEFSHFFDEIHPEFAKNLSSISKESLSPSELKLGMLLRLNLSSKEIASILRVTPDSVRVARHRLRKKLPLQPKDELVHFLLGL